MKAICFYHSADFDGICSGAIARHFIPKVELVGYDYGQPFPWEKVTPESIVYMVDVGLKPEEMERLQSEAKELHWVDHHITQIKAYKEYGLVLKGLQDVEKSGCELMWSYLSGDSPITGAVFHLGRYDVWDHGHDDTLPFQYGMRYLCTDGVDDPLWKILLYQDCYMAREVERIVEIGKTIQEYQRREDEKYALACAFDLNFKGHTFCAINRGLRNSQLFDAVLDPSRHDGMFMFYMNGKGLWKVSLYSATDNVNMGELAVEMGGGGHKKAAGFICSHEEMQEILGSKWRLFP